MNRPFDTFTAELTKEQLALLLDTVRYFEEAPKLLSIPSVERESIAVPLLSSTLQAMLETLEEEQQQNLRFTVEWISQAEDRGILRVSIDSGKIIEQETKLDLFSHM